MGKQINFYLERELEGKFIEELFNAGFVIVAEDLDNKKLITYNELKEVNSKIYILYLYKKDLGTLLINKECEYRLDYLRSPVIEFARTIIKSEKKVITRGRLWMESKYYGENGEIVCKDSKLTSEYNKLVKWIKKYVPFQDVAKGDYVIKEYVTDSIKELANTGFRLM